MTARTVSGHIGRASNAKEHPRERPDESAGSIEFRHSRPDAGQPPTKVYPVLGRRVDALPGQDLHPDAAGAPPAPAGNRPLSLSPTTGRASDLLLARNRWLSGRGGRSSICAGAGPATRMVRRHAHGCEDLLSAGVVGLLWPARPAPGRPTAVSADCGRGSGSLLVGARAQRVGAALRLLPVLLAA